MSLPAILFVELVHALHLGGTVGLKLEVREILGLVNLHGSGFVGEIEPLVLGVDSAHLTFNHIGIGTVGLFDELCHGDEEMLVLIAHSTGLLDVEAPLCQTLAGICLDDGGTVVAGVLGEGYFDCLRLVGSLSAEGIDAYERRVAGDCPVAGCEKSYLADFGADEITVSVELEGFHVEFAFRLGNVFVLIGFARHGSEAHKGDCRDCEKSVEFHDSYCLCLY